MGREVGHDSNVIVGHPSVLKGELSFDRFNFVFNLGALNS
jgi:hypothetical protein